MNQPPGMDQGQGRETADRIADARLRARLVVAGTVTDLAVRYWDGERTLESVLDDGTGSIILAFPGRPTVPGFTKGARVAVEGTVAEHAGRTVVWNPLYTFLP